MKLPGKLASNISVLPRILKPRFLLVCRQLTRRNGDFCTSHGRTLTEICVCVDVRNRHLQRCPLSQVKRAGTYRSGDFWKRHRRTRTEMSTSAGASSRRLHKCRFLQVSPPDADGNIHFCRCNDPALTEMWISTCINRRTPTEKSTSAANVRLGSQSCRNERRFRDSAAHRGPVRIRRRDR